MLFPYTYVPHKMQKMQKFINFIFYEVWCNAPKSGTFSLDLFAKKRDLHKVMHAFLWGDTAGGDFFYGHVERIYNEFVQLTPAQIAQFKQWYQCNNSIEKVCANNPATNLARYADITALHKNLSEQLATFFKGLYSKQLLDLAVLKPRIGTMDKHYKKFIKKNAAGKCPFCGISDMLGIYESPREAYDHYFPKKLYPFNSINFGNLVPACHHCNSSYKTSKDPAFTPKDPAGVAYRRKVFYPYSDQKYKIELKIQLSKLDIDHAAPDDITLQFGPAALSEEIETWKDIYGIEKRYQNKCLSSDAKDWLEQVRMLHRNHGLAHKAILKTISEQTENAPFANSNFLKKAFLEGCERGGLFIVET